MNYSIDPNKLYVQFTKQLLVYDNNMDETMSNILGNLLREWEIKHINSGNRVKIVSIFQDIFDAINPYVDNRFSAFDIDFDFDEGDFYFELRFMNDFEDITLHGANMYRDTIKIVYNEET